MNFRPEQFDAFAAASMDRTRRERLLSLNQQGFNVTDDPSGTVLVRDAAGHTAKVESHGLRVRVISPEGRATEIEQYASGRIRRVVDPSGREVRFERDADGFLQSIDRGADGGTYRFQLSPDWKPLRVEYSDGTATLADYTSTGHPSRIVHRDGSEIRYEYITAPGPCGGTRPARPASRRQPGSQPQPPGRRCRPPVSPPLPRQHPP